MMPQTYSEWRNCIENDCKIKLTERFIQERLNVYTNPKNAETKKFAQLYGTNHLKNVVSWLRQASQS